MDAAGGARTCCLAHLSANHTLPAFASCWVKHAFPPGGTVTCWFVHGSVSTMWASAYDLRKQDCGAGAYGRVTGVEVAAAEAGGAEFGPAKPSAALLGAALLG